MDSELKKALEDIRGSVRGGIYFLATLIIVLHFWK